MIDQKKNIWNGNWDNIIILDACRYDYFKDTYDLFLEGNLEKAKSPASCTEEWLKSTFTNNKFRDVTYISAMPHINSKKIDVCGFKGWERFGKVVDAWDFGWSEKYDTVPPWRMNEIVTNNFNPGGRNIFHYSQPHSPYLSMESNRHSKVSDSRPISSWLHGSDSNPVTRLVKKQINKGIGRKICRIIGQRAVWRLREAIGEEPLGVHKTLKEHGRGGLIKAYIFNLKKALEYVAKLIDELDGNTVITADHGESLGENGRYGHGSKLEDPEVRNVPWLELTCPHE